MAKINKFGYICNMYPWGDDRRFNSYSRYFRTTVGDRVQKLSVNAGFSCPNRDGSLLACDGAVGGSAGVGKKSAHGHTSGSAIVNGCTFCSNEAFTPSYCVPSKSITQQIDEGIEFHSRRYRRAERYLAYFQSFSNTYGSLDDLRRIYTEALAHPAVTGIVVGTRPDCIDSVKLDYFAQLAENHYVAIEYGVESTYDHTLRAVNRGHDFECARQAIEMTAERASQVAAGLRSRAARHEPAKGTGLHVGAHFILGLPGETEQMLIDQTDTINNLPLDTIKFHQLQIFRGTPMEHEYTHEPGKFTFWPTPEAYIDFFINILQRLRPSLVIERFAGEAPPRHQAGPTWGLVRNEQLLSMLERRLAELDTFQGELFRNAY